MPGCLISQAFINHMTAYQPLTKRPTSIILSDGLEITRRLQAAYRRAGNSQIVAFKSIMEFL